ncbi:MAG: hypothetical protein LBQ77_08810 [Treponema sp.]|jgi:hypothetical protein|nr:hypothetical protein [Treponema sp.]
MLPPQALSRSSHRIGAGYCTTSACLSEIVELHSYNTTMEIPGAEKAQQLSLNKLCLSRRGNLTTFSSVGGRIRVLHDISQWFINRYHILHTNDIQAGQLKYHVRKKVFYRCVQYRQETFCTLQHVSQCFIHRLLHYAARLTMLHS